MDSQTGNNMTGSNRKTKGSHRTIHPLFWDQKICEVSRKRDDKWRFLYGVHAMQCMCAQTRPRLYSYLKEVLWNEVRTHVNSKGNIPSTETSLRGGSNPRCCIKQDSQPNTLPTELSWLPGDCFVCGFFCMLICMRFFFFPLSDVLAYCVMLQAFICYCSFVRCSCCARARVCVLFIAIVQRNWACLTWKSALEIKSLLLLLLLLLLLACLTSQPATCKYVSGTDMLRHLTCCHTEKEAANQLDISSSHSTLTPGQPVQTLTLQQQASVWWLLGWLTSQ